MDESESFIRTKQLDEAGGVKTIPSYVLDDLSSRFIINAPPEELMDARHVFFKMEYAYWFYLDFHRVENAKLPECTLKEFSFNLMHHCPQLKQYTTEFQKHFEEWKSYTRKISTYGAIILDKELKHVLLVQSYGSKNSWGFPKGKINQKEAPVNCAVREVFEEIGFDITPYVDEKEYLESTATTNDQKKNRLYLIAGVPVNTVFQPKTRREIRDIQWFPMDTLPTFKGDQTLKETVGQNYNLYTVTPFLRELRRWISRRMADSTVSSKQKNKQKQQKLFAQQSQSQYQEFLALKKGKETGGKKATSQRGSSVVRYSGDIFAMGPNSSKQGKRGMTVFQTLFGNKDAHHMPVPMDKIPEVDTNSFYSQAWFDFCLDVDGIVALLPQEGNLYMPQSYT